MHWDRKMQHMVCILQVYLLHQRQQQCFWDSNYNKFITVNSCIPYRPILLLHCCIIMNLVISFLIEKLQWIITIRLHYFNKSYITLYMVAEFPRNTLYYFAHYHLQLYFNAEHRLGGESIKFNDTMKYLSIGLTQIIVCYDHESMIGIFCNKDYNRMCGDISVSLWCKQFST